MNKQTPELLLVQGSKPVTEPVEISPAEAELAEAVIEAAAIAPRPRSAPWSGHTRSASAPSKAEADADAKLGGRSRDRSTAADILSTNNLQRRFHPSRGDI